jgi:uncharacterized protein YjbI with pentapeptide repeats
MTGFLCASAIARDKAVKEPWTGKLGNGTVITKADLQQILKDHQTWVRSDGERGHRADFTGANLKDAYILGANLSNAIMVETDLSNALLHEVDISDANMLVANLNDTKLINADLSNTYLMGANLKNVLYEPKLDSIPLIPPLIHAKNLENMKFRNFSHGMMALRRKFQEYGYREQERKITYALKHSSTQHLLWSDDLSDIIEGSLRLILFEHTSKWGLSPGRPLLIMIYLIGLFSIPYMLSLCGLSNKHCVWRDWTQRGSRLDSGIAPSEQLTCSSGPQIWGYGLYFSLLSAVHIGWRDLNVGNWITRIQPREYTLRATGWVRTVSGIQSLISVYLLALAVLTYFGRPFDQF